MAPPCGNSQLCYEMSPNSVVSLVPSSAMDLIPSSAVDKNPWLRHVATPSSAVRRPLTQLWALKQKQPEVTPNLVAGPVYSSAADSVPSLAMDKKGIKLMHMEGSAT
jgi:hypothetical protein